MRTGYGNTRSLRGVLNFQNVNLDTLGRLEDLALYLLCLVQDGVHLAQVDADVLAQVTLYDTGYHILLLLVPLVKLHAALFLTDFLQDDILCVLGSDTTKGLGLDRNVDDVAQEELRVFQSCFRVADLG